MKAKPRASDVLLSPWINFSGWAAHLSEFSGDCQDASSSGRRAPSLERWIFAVKLREKKKHIHCRHGRIMNHNELIIAASDVQNCDSDGECRT